MLGKFARVVLRHASTSTTTAASAWPRPRPPAARFGLDRGLPFPLADIPEAEADPDGRRQPRRNHAAADAVLRRAAAPGGQLIVVDPRRTPTARERRPAPAAHARHRRGARQRPAARRDPRKADRPGLHRGAHDRLRGGRGTWSPPTGRTGWSASPASRQPASWRRRSCWARPRPPWSSPRAAPEQQTPRRRQRRCASSTSPSPSARRAGPVQRLGHASPARATARAGASTGRRPTSCPATGSIDDPAHRAHMAAVWGVDEATLPGPGPAGDRAPGRARHARCAACWSWAPTRWSRPPTAGRSSDGCARSTCWSSPTSSCRRPPQLADVVLPVTSGPRRRDDHEPRRPVILPPPAAAAAARRAHRSRGAEGAGRPARRGERSAPTRASLFEELRRASAGGNADYAGISYARIAAEDGVFWPCPRGGPARHAPAVPGALRHARRPRTLPRRPAPSAGRGAGRRLSPLPHHRPGAAALPVRHPDPPRAGAGRGRARALRRNPPADGAQFRRRRRRARPPAHAARDGAAPGAPQPAIRLDTLFVPFHCGGSGRRQPAHQRRASIRSRRSRSSRSARSRIEKAGRWS